MNPIRILSLFPALAALALTACMSEPEPVPAKEEPKSAFIDPGDFIVVPFQFGTTNINFQDPAALARIRGFPEYTADWVTKPGYIQSVGSGASMQIFISEGPLPLPIMNDTDGFQITWTGSCWRELPSGEYKLGKLVGNQCRVVPDNVERFHRAYSGRQWLAGCVSAPGKLLQPFDLLKIRVKGTVAVVLKYRLVSNGALRTLTLQPGYHDIAGATGVREFHISAASGRDNDRYSVDDILVRYLP